MGIGLSAAGALYHVVPQWFFLPQIRGIYQSYSKGFKTQVRNELLELLNVVAKDMDLSDDEISSLTVFVTTTTEPNGWVSLGKRVFWEFQSIFIILQEMMFQWTK